LVFEIMKKSGRLEAAAYVLPATKCV